MRSKIHWLSIALAYSTLFLLGLSDNLRGPLFPEVLADLQLNDSKGSLLWAMASFFGLIGSASSNWLIGRRGQIGSLQLALILMSIGQFGMAFSQSFYWALLSCFVFGLSLGILGVVQNLLVLKAGPVELLPQLQAGLHSNYALSSLLAPLFLSIIHVFHPSWRAGYFGGATLALLGFLILFFVPREGLSTDAGVPSHKTEVSESTAAESQTLSFRDKLGAFHVGIILALYVLTEIMVSSRLALYLRRELSYSFEQSNIATTSFFVLLFIGRFAFIFWKPKLLVWTQLLISLSITFIFCIAGLLVSPLLLILTGLSMAPFFPLAMAYLQERLPDQLNYAMTVAMSLVGFFVVSMHLLVGVFSDSFGITKALLIGPLAVAIAIALLLLDRRSVE